MMNNYVSTVFGVLGVLAALTFPATPGNAAEAQTVLGGKLVVCGVCHGVNGLPKLEGVPIIWSLQENYILKQLRDFQRGDRASDTMKKVAITLTEEELGPTAAYFATKQWPEPAKNASSSSPPPTMAVCEACHQQKLVGSVAAPRLAGQKYDYLVESMRRFAEGQRKNSPEMSSIMQAISASDREAMARYISGL
jgi:cytochrome c553